MKNILKTIVYFLLIFIVFFISCSQQANKQSEQFDLTDEEHLFLEKFFRSFMLCETAIYTLVGSKPLTDIILAYENKSENIQDKTEYIYFLLNKSSEKDMKFYKTLSSFEKKEKAFLVEDKNFIYDIEDLWDKWEKIQHRFNIKKQFLLVKKECPESEWKDIFPRYTAMYEVFFVDVFKTANIIQENYGLFKQAVGFDFDPFKVVLELQNNSSKFWDIIGGKDPWKYSYLWGLLYGFGEKNSFYHYWNSRHYRDSNCEEKEKLVATSIKKWSSCKYKHRPSFSDPDAHTISNFTIPIFVSYTKKDPVVIQYEKEKKSIKNLYKGKDFVKFTLELLTEKSKK
ncbi:MAG: hypothetical protein ACD_79C01256G0001 [uncultured bacterium]|nr:MAG: hypothetical protein ACD_79C01256G0001 [uncultured bacterium]